MKDGVIIIINFSLENNAFLQQIKTLHCDWLNNGENLLNHLIRAKNCFVLTFTFRQSSYFDNRKRASANNRRMAERPSSHDYNFFS